MENKEECSIDTNVFIEMIRFYRVFNNKSENEIKIIIEDYKKDYYDSKDKINGYLNEYGINDKSKSYRKIVRLRWGKGRYFRSFTYSGR